MACSRWTYLANLPAICDLAESHKALVMVDDSRRRLHARARLRTHEHHAMDRVDITGTLGKALGGASGGYTSGREESSILRQTRAHIFSNTVASIVAASIKAIELLNTSTDLRDRGGQQKFREQMAGSGFHILEGRIRSRLMLGDAALAALPTPCSKRASTSLIFLSRCAPGQGPHPHANLRRPHAGGSQSLSPP